MDDTKITLFDEDGAPEEFYVIEQTAVNGVNYLLVAETLEDETDAYILKDNSEDSAGEALYEFVDDDSEIEYIGNVFAQLLGDEDTDII